MEFLKTTGGTCTLLRMLLVGENKDLSLSKGLCVLSAPNTDVAYLANASQAGAHKLSPWSSGLLWKLLWLTYTLTSLVKGQIMSTFVPPIALLQFVSPILWKPDSSTYHSEVENLNKNHKSVLKHARGFQEHMTVLIGFQIMIFCWHKLSNLCASITEWWVDFSGWLRDRRSSWTMDFQMSPILSLCWRSSGLNILENSPKSSSSLIICLPNKHLVHILKNYSDGSVVVASYHMTIFCPFIYSTSVNSFFKFIQSFHIDCNRNIVIALPKWWMGWELFVVPRGSFCLLASSEAWNSHRTHLSVLSFCHLLLHIY